MAYVCANEGIAFDDEQVVQAYTKQLLERRQSEQRAAQDPNMAGIAYSQEQQNLSMLFYENESDHSPVPDNHESREAAMIRNQDPP